MRAGRERTALPSFHSQPNATSSFGLRSLGVNTPKERDSVESLLSFKRGTEDWTEHGVWFTPATDEARSRRGPMGWTKGFGMPRWAYVLRGSAG